MNKLLLITFLILSMAWLNGCRNPDQTLKLYHYRRNLIIRRDNIVTIENEEIKVKNLKKELLSRMIISKTPITLHVHKFASYETFDEVYNQLKKDGFRNIEFQLFRDPE